MQHQQFLDSKGNPIKLGDELGRGGEGAIFEIQGNNSIVAKIYLKEPDQIKAAKINTMVGIKNERLCKLATWPLFLIYNRSGILMGFAMSKLIKYKPIFELYNPKLRLQEFPQADWRFLIHAAANTARAFSVIHEAGHVIGDVNHGNLVIAQDATVKLIDTDSFQVAHNGKYWFCEVGVPTHQPPEMQGHSTYQGIIRSQNHDNFGLAVIIFQLLCLARHPFSGRFLGQGEMPMEKAISEFRFAYATDSYITQMTPPPASLSLKDLTPRVSYFFEKAFSKKCLEGARPTAVEWVAALQELSSQLQKC
jgi:DNA-binding helix-hairpin-helix protein with protein kinase domain